jgi:hypothetical protein
MVYRPDALKSVFSRFGKTETQIQKRPGHRPIRKIVITRRQMQIRKEREIEEEEIDELEEIEE